MSTPTSHNSVLPALHHALSGSLGTLISTCALYPLSLVITRQQVQRQLSRDPDQSTAPAAHPHPSHTSAAGVRAPTSQTQTRLAEPSLLDLQDHHAHAQHAAQDQTTGITGPRDAHGTTERQEEESGSQQPEGIAETFSSIYSSSPDGGARALYTGLRQDAVKSVLDSFLFFLFYEWFRALRLSVSAKRRKGRGRGLGVVEELAVGCAAGAASRALTTPVGVVVTRLQTKTLTGEYNGEAEGRGREVGVRQIVREIKREKGVAGFWAGYSASLVLTLNPALTFFLHEWARNRYAEASYDDPGAKLTFLFAACSKAASCLVTYPFSIAKTRMQAGVVPADSEADGEEEGSRNPYHAQREADGSEEEEDVHKEIEHKLAGLRTVRNFAKRSVFGQVAQIVRTEGVASLYDGVGAELLKGFFSHGTTMLAKGVVHKLLFKLYLFVVGVLAELRRRRGQNRGGETGFGGLEKVRSVLSRGLMGIGREKGKSVGDELKDNVIRGGSGDVSGNVTGNVGGQGSRVLKREVFDDRIDWEEKLPRALRYRIDRSERDRTADYGLNVVANLIDGTQRPFRGDRE
ncbi:mitochondrial carrier domain-containing protein [Xylariaceae sp. FL1019]|nr:mitochondrial carrier domain-containing protein [Xylariaceae sp. FL1019]